MKEFPDSEEKIYRLLQGLVKIQALIRGFLTRNKIKLMFPPPPRIRLQRNNLNHATTNEEITFLEVNNPLRLTDLALLPSAAAAVDEV